MSTILDVRGLRKAYGARVLFDGADLSVARGEKVGVIGRNGSGKSTLLGILAGDERPDEGTVALRRGVTVGFLPQEPRLDPERTVIETVAGGRAGFPDALSEFDEVARALSEGPPPEETSRLLARQSALSSRIEGMGGWDWRHQAEAILTRLGIDQWDRRMETLSGGERRRVALARTLLAEPELLLLDEPTNHLDAETILWLEETLFDVPGAALLVTHDRYFLDRVVDRMIEVTHQGFTSYDGGYTEYLEERAAREARERVEEAKRTKLLEKELAWARRSPPARTGKQKARRAQARELGRAQRERERTRPSEAEIEISDAPRLGRTVLEAHGLTREHDGRVLFRGFSDRVLAGEKIGIVGPNGCGKTTLLRVLLGLEPADEGEVVLGENTRIGYLDQARELDPDLSVARAVSEADRVTAGGREMHLRAYLDRFLFPAHVHDRPVRSLSGGERSRLLLARLFLGEFNLLVLDEPTNDLDLDTLRMLEARFEEFEGCILLVTHDRYLLDRIATSLLVFEGEGRLHRHHGSWDSYLGRRDALREEAEPAREAKAGGRRKERAESSRPRDRPSSGSPARLSFNEQRELAGLEERIAELEAERDGLGRRLADPALYQEEGEEVARATRRFHEAEETLRQLYARWMELEERSAGSV